MNGSTEIIFALYRMLIKKSGQDGDAKEEMNVHVESFIFRK